MTKYRKPSQEELREILKPEEFRVTQEDGTEMPFQNQISRQQ